MIELLLKFTMHASMHFFSSPLSRAKRVGNHMRWKARNARLSERPGSKMTRFALGLGTARAEAAAHQRTAQPEDGDPPYLHLPLKRREGGVPFCVPCLGGNG